MRELDDLMLPGEELLWDGAPEPGIHLRKEDAVLIPFSIFWTGAVSFWEFSVVSANAPLLFKVWGIPFVLIGLYMLFGRLIVSARRAAHTVYAVTNRRVLIVTRDRQRAIELNRIPCLEFQKHRSGLGTIFFDKNSSLSQNQIGKVSFSADDSRLAFRNIRDSESVYRLISQRTNQS